MRSTTSTIKQFDARALCDALAQGRIGAIRRSAKNMPMCIFIASVCGEECRFALLPALRRLLPNIHACMRAYRRYIHIRMMRSMVVQLAHTLVYTQEDQQIYLSMLVDHEVRENQKKQRGLARFERLARASNM